MAPIERTDVSTDGSTHLDRYNLDDSRVGLAGYSPVSYVDLGQAQLGRQEFSSEHDGVKYYFTDEDQRRRFVSHPAKYAPAFGGWCAFGMTVDKRFRPNPTKFKVVDGRLLMFLNDLEVDAAALWNEGNDLDLLKEADENWDGYRQ
jgi:YHS domain-containing protein